MVVVGARSALTRAVKYTVKKEGDMATVRDRPYPGMSMRRRSESRNGGAMGSLTWYNWWNDARSGNPGVLRAVLVQLLNEDRSGVVLSWKFLRAQPANYQYSPLNAVVSETLIESLELAFERMELV